MNEIVVKTITKTPAVIEFNHQELIEDLENNLKKYDGLTFTEDETADLRKTIAELRKGVKVVDRYRIDTKKELNAPVTKFEKQCKEIVSKFDERIDKLDKQLKDFEAERKAKKTVKVQEIIANVINEYPALNKKYADRLVVKDEHLAKSISNNRLKEMILFQADQLLQMQEKENADREVIETFIKLKNSEYGLNLSVEPYHTMLEFKSPQDVKTTIEDDVQKELVRKSRVEAEKQAQAEIKQTFEPEIIEILNQDNDLPFTPAIDDLPFGDVIEEQERSITLGIVVTESQLNAVKMFLDGQGIIWEVFADDTI